MRYPSGSPKKTVPGKRGRGRPKKLDATFNSKQYGSILNSVEMVVLNTDDQKRNGNTKDQMAKESPSKQQRDRRASSDVGEDDSCFVSPKNVKLDIVDELPEDIRKEILTGIRKSGHYLRNKRKIDRERSIQKRINQVSEASMLSREGGNAEVVDNTTPNASSAVIVSPSQLDQSFLRAIPDDMREEILEHTSANRKKLQLQSPGTIDLSSRGNDKVITNLTSASHDLLTPSQLDNSVLNALPDNIRQEVLQTTIRRSHQEQLLHQQQSHAETPSKHQPLLMLLNDSGDNENKRFGYKDLTEVL